MGHDPGFRPERTIIRMPIFEELHPGRRTFLRTQAGLFNLDDPEALHDEWLEILKDHEAVRWGETESMEAVALLQADEKRLNSFLTSTLQASNVLRDFTAVDDRAFTEILKGPRFDEPDGALDRSRVEKLAQHLLRTLAALNATLRAARDRRLAHGRPTVHSRHETARRLLFAWARRGLSVPSRGERRPDMKVFFDFVTKDLEYRFHAGWTAHNLSSRHPQSEDQVLHSCERFSLEVARVRNLLSPAARARAAKRLDPE